MIIKSFSADLLNPEEFENLRTSLPKYNLIWTDPPWGDGILKVFRNKINKMGADGTWPTLMTRLAILCHATELGSFVMMGKRFTPQLVEIFKDFEMPLKAKWEGVYGANKTPLGYLEPEDMRPGTGVFDGKPTM